MNLSNKISRLSLAIAVSVTIYAGYSGIEQLSAQEHSVKPGMNQGYQDRDIEVFIKSFESQNREVFKHRDAIVDACQLKPGMAVADIGAGTGFFTRLFAEKVGKDGTVYAVDITKNFIDHIEKTCKKDGLKQVKTVLSTDKSCEMDDQSADLIFVCDTYHHFEYPATMLGSMHKVLRENGRIVLVEFRKEIDGKVVTNHVRANRADLICEFQQAGFQFTGEKEMMKKQMVLMFKKCKKSAVTCEE